MSRSEKLIFKGTPKQTQYVSCDKDGKDEYTISCRQGDEIWVTPAKKADLLKDHGEWFVEPKSGFAKEIKKEFKKLIPKPETALEEDPETAISDYEVPDEPAKITPTVDFESMTNAELRKLAKTDNKRLSKKKLIKMITDKKKE